MRHRISENPVSAFPFVAQRADGLGAVLSPKPTACTFERKQRQQLPMAPKIFGRDKRSSRAFVPGRKLAYRFGGAFPRRNLVIRCHPCRTPQFPWRFQPSAKQRVSRKREPDVCKGSSRRRGNLSRFAVKGRILRRCVSFTG